MWRFFVGSFGGFEVGRGGHVLRARKRSSERTATAFTRRTPTAIVSLDFEMRMEDIGYRRRVSLDRRMRRGGPFCEICLRRVCVRK